jgi:hypothetical protein
MTETPVSHTKVRSITDDSVEDNPIPNPYWHSLH